MKSKAATTPDLEWELRLGHPRVIVAGVDEVGRGCLAGPVVAAAVILPADFRRLGDGPPWLREVADSKLLSPAKREELSPLLMAWVRAHAIGQASVEEIDRINIHHASHLAMVRAIAGLGVPADHVLVDGKFVPKELRGRATAVIKGDCKCLAIACASVIAKVWRDRKMAELDAAHPGYGFGVHKGYSTPAHNRALASLGVCEIHRKSFAPVASLLSAGPVEP